MSWSLAVAGDDRHHRSRAAIGFPDCRLLERLTLRPVFRLCVGQPSQFIRFSDLSDGVTVQSLKHRGLI
jgi:hypothetical protein